MNKQPKTPRTKRHHLVCDVFGPHKWMPGMARWPYDGTWTPAYRRLPKGKRAKSGQWWRRIPVEFQKVFDQITAEDIREGYAQIARGEYVTIDEMRRQIREQWLETHDEVDTDTGFGPIWIPK